MSEDSLTSLTGVPTVSVRPHSENVLLAPPLTQLDGSRWLSPCDGSGAHEPEHMTAILYFFPLL